MVEKDEKIEKLTSEEIEALGCPLRPKWAASMIANIGPRGELARLAKCPSVKKELQKIKIEMGLEE